MRRGAIGAFALVLTMSVLGLGASSAWAIKSILVVNTTADESLTDNPEACEDEAGKPKSEKCALRAALELQRSVVVSGASSLEVFVPKGTYTISGKGALVLGNFHSGSCEGGVKCPVELVGESATETVIDGANATNLINAFDNDDTIENLTLENGHAGVGGAVKAEGVPLVTLRHVHLNHNSATEEGGALYGAASGFRVVESDLLENSALQGGAIYEANNGVTLESVSMIKNTASSLGGVAYVSHGSLTAVESTAFANNAQTGSFEIGNVDAVTLVYSTIAGNTGPLPFANAVGGSPLQIRGSIIAGNSGQQCAATALEALEANIVYGASACEATGAAPLGVDPKLGAAVPVAFGSVLPLERGSPAINAGASTCPAAGSADARGVARPQGSACDLGAWEAAADAGVSLSAAPETVTVGGAQTLTASARSNGSEAASGVTLTIPLPAGTRLVSAPAGCSASFAATTTVSCALGELAPGQTAARSVVVRPERAGAQLDTASVATTGPDYSAADDSVTIATTALPTSAPPSGGKGTGTGHAAKATLAGRTLTVDRHGNLLAKVHCAASSSGGCVTTLDIYAASGTLPASASARKALLLGQAHVTIAAGRTALVHVKLSRSTRRKLTPAHPRLLARALLSARGSTGATATQRYSVLLKREARRRR